MSGRKEMKLKMNVVKLFTDHGWYTIRMKTGVEPEKTLKKMITDFKNKDASRLKFQTFLANEDVDVEIRRMIVNGNEIFKSGQEWRGFE